MEFTGEAVKIEAPDHFDEFGAILDLPRIPDETLSAYRTRLLDVFDHRAGNDHIGLMYGINRALGLRYYDAGLVVRPRKRIDNQPVVRDLSMSIEADGIHFYTVRFESRESHVIPTDTLRVDLNYQITSADPVIEYQGSRLERQYYWVDEVNNQIEFHHDYAGETITVTYNYHKTVPLNQSMSDVVADIDVVRIGETGSYVAQAELAQGCLGTDTGEGLAMLDHEYFIGYRPTATGDYYNEIHCPWGEVSVRALHDPDYINANLSQHGTYFGTVLMRLVEAARNIAHVTWSQMTFGRDRFNPAMGLAEIPTLLDGRVGRWRCSDPAHTRTYRPEEAAALSMKCPHDSYQLVKIGIGPKQMQSGVGGKDDLKLVAESGSGEDFDPTIYDVAALLNGSFTTPSTTTENEMDAEDL